MKDYKFYYFPVPQEDQNGKIFYVPKPIIDVAINYSHNKPIVIKSLIDSGADHNLLPAQLGEALGLNIKKGKKQIITGIGGIQIESFLHNKLGIFIEGNKIESFAYFSYQQQIPLLGQNGFFDRCNRVVFDRKKEEIIISI